MDNTFFWGVKQCNLVDRYQGFGGICYLHFHSEDFCTSLSITHHNIPEDNSLQRCRCKNLLRKIHSSNLGRGIEYHNWECTCLSSVTQFVRSDITFKWVTTPTWQITPISRIIILKCSIFLDKAPCSQVKFNRRFGEIYHLYIQGWRVSQARTPPPLSFTGPHCVISQIVPFIATTVRTSITTQ
jgi:hypothetical protein